MKSNNPVFQRSEAFNGTSHQSYAGDPATWGTGTPGMPTHQAPVERMTIDSVVQKTAISLGVVFAAAIVTWMMTPDLRDPSANLGPLIGAITIGSLAAFGLSMVNAFKKVVSPPLVLAFAVAEGIALGALSKLFDAQFSSPDGGSIVTQAVLGTFAAFAGTLAAYKFFNIQVGAKFRTFVIAAVFGMIGLSLLEMLLGAFGNQFGLFGFGAMGMLFAVAGLVLGIFMLILDFDFVEKGIAAGIEERESWRAAFAMTVSLVWIYTNLLRLLAIFNQD
ncbi:Bax inhibitor-1/YccA family protein [Nocardioides sp.]|uniref:Bax inhibitor-1/YccA family protein n=1 Tax=Nocardioides sp. TaxID=35761 RepID=UPI00356B4D30